MSSGQLARDRSLSLGSGHSADIGLESRAQFSMPSMNRVRDFEPCAATASMFLYAQGNSVVCAHHDTLTIERRFLQHTEEILLLAVDTVSDKGNGRLVVSYDAGQTCIVWDLMTGVTIQKFSSFSDLTAAAWMRNGNACFGNSQGEVTLFEPSTNEHLSARTLDQIPVTSIAPVADCSTYAIGYQNGSLLIATLQPRFTILHNLTTSKGPSPVVTLAWHASSSKQKSDMLATQTQDGDVRVWSIAKSPTSTDVAKVVRVLRRSENYQPGANWLGWSKNGRIVQYSEGETSSWDVRTKHVTYENVPTLEHVKGLAIYGPGATLFTLGPNNTVQQFDLSSTPQMVTNIQHPANVLPPSPPVSIEEQKNQNKSAAGGPTSVPVNLDVSESDEDHMSPLARIAREMDKLNDQPHELDRGGALSPVSQSSRSQASVSSMSSADSRSRRKHSSVISRGMSDATSMSFGTSLHTDREPSLASSRDSFSMSSLSSASHTSSHRSRPRASRLRQEVLLSPEEKQVIDLFKFTKLRLSDIPYRHPQVPDNIRLTNDDLRRQMLSTIFGWEGEVDAMISDEMRRHPVGSPNALLLAKWLGDIDTDVMATSSESMTSSDWMLLALSGIGGLASQHKVARAYVQRLLEKGDVHTAATIMIGMGDQNDAIEIYVSHKRYMEALILTALVFPSDWKRQTELIRKWGEWAVQHGQQQLAIRCFSCTVSESSEPWSSPSAQAATFSSQMQAQSIPEILSPPLSPPGAYGPQRSIAKTSALKLITSFGDKSGKSKFFGVGEDDRTPIGGLGVTPIAESALSPSGGDTAHTAFLRPSHRSAYNTPASARTATPGGFTRRRLPSIGEMPSDTSRPTEEPARLPTPADSGSDAELNLKLARLHERTSSQPEILNSATYQPVNRSFTASPMVQKGKLLNDGSNPLPSPSPESFTATKQDLRTRNGSRDRKPDGLQIQWPPMESIITGDYMTSPQVSTTSSSRHRPTTSRSVAESTSGSVTGSVSSMSSYAGKYGGKSPLASGNSYHSFGNSSPVVTGRSLDQYISSLESAQHHAQKQRSRHASHDKPEDRQRSASRKVRAREASEERGRSNTRYIKPAKRSPTSPIPMSPEDLRVLGAEGFGDGPHELKSPMSDSRRIRGDSQATAKAGSKPSSRIRRLSPEPVIKTVGSKPSSRAGSRNASRRPSPGHLLTSRGRSKGREGSALRSPSSPLPMSPQARLYQADDEDAEAPPRLRSRQRSNSRLRARGTSAVRGVSPDRRRRERSGSRKPTAREGSRSRDIPAEPSPRRDQRDISQTTSEQRAIESFAARSERTLKQELAARELEERRKSLARRPSAPTIIHPEDLASLSPTHERSNSGSPFFLQNLTYPALPPRSQTTSPEASRVSPSYNREKEQTRVSPAKVSPPYRREGEGSPKLQIGLPATPRAMQHPKYDPDGTEIPEVPQIPDSYAPTGPLPSAGTLNAVTYNGLGPLPKTTYQANNNVRQHMPPRSMSAPIPEEPPLSPHALPAALPTHPAFQAALPPSSLRRQNSRASALPPVRKINPGNSQPGMLGYEARNNSPVYSSHSGATMVGIEETIEASSQPINPSNNNLTPPPPPPPPAPPILKELQHLAMPPPPPPAPLYYPHNSNTMSINSLGSGVSQGSGVIEIVMDDDEEEPAATKPNRTPPNLVVEIPPPPPEPRARTSSISHNRGRSFNDKDNSISGRISRATERIRSASRGRSANNSPLLNRTTKSPTEASPYESIPPPMFNVGEMRNAAATAAAITERHPREVAATYASTSQPQDGNPFVDHGGMI